MNPLDERLIENMLARGENAKTSEYTMTNMGILRYMEVMTALIVDATVHDDMFNDGKQLHVISLLPNGANVVEFVKLPDNGVVSERSLLGKILGSDRGLKFDSPEEVADYIVGIESEVYVYVRDTRGTPTLRIDRNTLIEK